MLVSVIIPVYNCERYISKAIDSAINQTFKDYEIIVVDDGSTDSTPSILKQYDSIRVVTQENKGISGALNAGIKASSGEWIKWLSADDEMLPNCLEKLSLLGEKNTIFYTHYHIIDQFGKRIKDFVEPDRPVSDLWERFFGNGSSSFIHKDVFEKCGLFDESLRFGEDYELWLRCTMIYGVNLTLIPIFTVNYRRHPDQMTNRVGGGNDKLIKERIKGMMK